MLTAIVARIVDFSVRRAWWVVGVSLLLVVACAVYVAGHFAINTDVGRLLATNAPWAQREAALDKAFPQRGDSTLIVVRAPARELVMQAARELAARLRQQPGMFRAVNPVDSNAFFTRNGLLFLAASEVDELTRRLGDARPLLNALAHDPTLRGLSNLLTVSLLVPLQTGQLHLPDIAPLLARAADAIDGALAGRPAAMSWSAWAAPDAATAGPSIIEVRPVRNYEDLEPGAASARAIRAAAAQLQLTQRYGATVALTGAIPLADEEFSSVQEGAVLSGIITAHCVLFILWLALRSAKLVLAVFLNMAGGLVVTAALGLLMVGSLNIISAAFAVLFVGIGVDFGIQFGVRFREKRFGEQEMHLALVAAARSIALPLTLAATATAVGFLAFMPTDYRGVAELGQIAGIGILFVAFPSCLTLLPALIALLRPRGRETMPGWPWLAPVDHLFQRHRKPLLAGTIVLVLAASPLLLHLRFDFDPLHLKNPNSESMATLTALANSPAADIDNVKVLCASLADAQALGMRVAQLPQVERVMTLASFVPEQQPEKLRSIARAAGALLPVLQQARAEQAGDIARIASLRSAARALRNAALDHAGPGAAEAGRLSASLTALAKADTAARERAERAVALPLQLALANLQAALQPEHITLENLPPALRQDWIAADGRALLDIAPRKNAGSGLAQDTQMRRFAEAVLRIAPAATGGPISAMGSAALIIHAFIEAAILALLAIVVLLWAALRRFGDVLLTVAPLLVSALVTLELCVVFGIAVNFANIIALPLLLGIGVAFKIYYMLAWRGGQAELLPTGLTQAIVLSAATTATAFGSLWLSMHPGTASMGKLLTLSLGCTLIGAVFFQPILMGKPRHPTEGKEAK